MATSWHHKFSRVDKAWDKLPKDSAGKIDWADVTAAHLDTGYSEHPAFGPWVNGKSSIILTDEGKSFIAPANGKGRDPFKQTNIMQPGHGTRSGSALAGLSPELSGAAPGLPVIPLRVTNSSLVTEKVAKAIGRALKHIVDKRLAPVVSISLGFPLLNGPEMGSGVDYAYENGVIIVAAGGQVIDRMTYPGKHLRTIGVGGIERYRFQGQARYRIYQEYDFYNRIDSWAPADPVERGTAHLDYSGVTDPDDLYGVGDGTTYATVHVAAAAAMWCRHHGLGVLRQKYKHSWEFVEAFRQCLFKSEQPFRMPPDKQPQGTRGKMLDAKKLLEVALPDAADLRIEADLAADDRM